MGAPPSAGPRPGPASSPASRRSPAPVSTGPPDASGTPPPTFDPAKATLAPLSPAELARASECESCARTGDAMAAPGQRTMRTASQATAASPAGEGLERQGGNRFAHSVPSRELKYVHTPGATRPRRARFVRGEIWAGPLVLVADEAIDRLLLADAGPPGAQVPRDLPEGTGQRGLVQAAHSRSRAEF